MTMMRKIIACQATLAFVLETKLLVYNEYLYTMMTMVTTNGWFHRKMTIGIMSQFSKMIQDNVSSNPLLHCFYLLLRALLALPLETLKVLTLLIFWMDNFHTLGWFAP